MKKKIFIGSSKEALPILTKVERLLEASFDILRWNTVFELNKSTLDGLIETAIKVDGAVFIGTADDFVIDVTRSRGIKTKCRDNVIFEFGLFLGMLGRTDCIYLVDKASDIMSDYSGITVVIFDKENLEQTLSDAAEKIKSQFEKYSMRDINLFPSVFLASAYFVNFIQPIFNHYLHNNRRIITDKGRYAECEIIVVLPATISNDVNKQADEIRKKYLTRSETIEYLGRNRGIVVDTSSNKHVIKILDFPTITAGIYHAVYSLLPNERLKQTPDYSAIFTRELQRFAEALKIYINEDPCKSISVTVKKEDQIIVDAPRRRQPWLKFPFLKR